MIFSKRGMFVNYVNEPSVQQEPFRTQTVSPQRTRQASTVNASSQLKPWTEKCLAGKHTKARAGRRHAPTNLYRQRVRRLFTAVSIVRVRPSKGGPNDENGPCQTTRTVVLL